MTDTPALPQTFWGVLAARLLPDARGWCAIAVFAFAWRILWMIDSNPTLLDSAPFMGLAGGILGAGGIGLVLAFHFGSSSGTAKANERADKAVQRADAASAGSSTITAPPPAEVTVSTPAEQP